MRTTKNLGVAAALALTMIAFVGASNASATTVRVGGVTQTGSVAISMSLASGTSLLVKDSFGTTTDTCTEATVKEATESPFTGTVVGGKASNLTYGKCSHTTTVINAGKTDFEWIVGTNSATVFSTDTEVTVLSTAFGASAVCKTGSKTHIGVLTGYIFSFFPKLHYNAKISCGILGTATVTGEYTVTSPEKLEFTS